MTGSARRRFLPLWQADAEVVLLKADVLRTKLDCLNYDGRASTGMSPSAFATAQWDGSVANIRSAYQELFQGAAEPRIWNTSTTSASSRMMTDSPARMLQPCKQPKVHHSSASVVLDVPVTLRRQHRPPDASTMLATRAELVMDEFSAQRARSLSPCEIGTSSKQRPDAPCDFPTRTAEQHEPVSPTLAGHFEQVLITFEPLPGQHGPELAVQLQRLQSSTNSPPNSALVLTVQTVDHPYTSRTHELASCELLDGKNRCCADAKHSASALGVVQHGFRIEDSEHSGESARSGRQRGQTFKSEMEKYHAMRRRLEAYRQTLRKCKMK
jgi:hypothetical protein